MAGRRAMGAKLTYKVGSGSAQYIAHLTSLGAINTANEEIDVTDHDSPNGNQEFIAGAQTHDNVSFAGNIAPSDDTFSRIWSLVQARTTCSFTATYADGSKLAFDGYFASVSMGEQTTDGLMGYEGEIKVSGNVTFTGSASA